MASDPAWSPEGGADSYRTVQKRALSNTCDVSDSRQPQRILLTGHRGQIGWWLHRFLRKQGYEVKGFDVRDGDDVRDLDALLTSAEGCDALVHCAVLQWNSPRPESEM